MVVIKHFFRDLSKFLPETLDRSKLVYCDIIYQIPGFNNKNKLGVTFNTLMEKVEGTQ